MLYRYSTLPEWEPTKESDYEEINTPSSANDGKVVGLYEVYISSHLKMDILPQFKEWQYRFYDNKHGHEHRKRGLSTNGIPLELVHPNGTNGMVCNGVRCERWRNVMMGS